MIHVHVYVCRNEAFLQLRMAVRVLRVAVRVLGVALYFNSTVTFFLFLLRGLGGKDCHAPRARAACRRTVGGDF